MDEGEIFPWFIQGDTPKELHSQVNETSSGRTSGETNDGAEGARPKRLKSLRQKDRVYQRLYLLCTYRGQVFFRFGSLIIMRRKFHILL